MLRSALSTLNKSALIRLVEECQLAGEHSAMQWRSKATLTGRQLSKINRLQVALEQLQSTTLEQLEAQRRSKDEDHAEQAKASEQGMTLQKLGLEVFKAHNSSTPYLEEGQVLKGTVMRVDRKTVWVDVGLPTHVKFFRSELSIEQVAETSADRERTAKDDLRVGDVLHLQLDDLETPFGYPLMNTEPTKGALTMVMLELEQALTTGKSVQGRVLNPVKGGVAVGVAGTVCFCPYMYCSPDTAQQVGLLNDFTVVSVQKTPPKAVLRDVRTLYNPLNNPRFRDSWQRQQQFAQARPSPSAA